MYKILSKVGDGLQYFQIEKVKKYVPYVIIYTRVLNVQDNDRQIYEKLIVIEKSIQEEDLSYEYITMINIKSIQSICIF